MPSQQRVGGNDRGEVGENLPSQPLGLVGQATALVVAESQALVAELLAKNPVLLTKVVNHLQLALVHPAGDGYQEESQGIQKSRHLVDPLSTRAAMRRGSAANRKRSSFRAIRGNPALLRKTKFAHLWFADGMRFGWHACHSPSPSLDLI